MATDCGWFRSRQIAGPNKLSPLCPMEIEKGCRRVEQNRHGGGGRRWGRPREQPLPNLRRGRVMVNPFDLRTALLAKHAQHVVLIHFPIALFIAAVIFDLIAHWTQRRGLADAAYYNLLGAGVSHLPAL